jgi:hypothetical protein
MDLLNLHSNSLIYDLLNSILSSSFSSNLNKIIYHDIIISTHIINLYHITIYNYLLIAVLSNYDPQTQNLNTIQTPYMANLILNVNQLNRDDLMPMLHLFSFMDQISTTFSINL